MKLIHVFNNQLHLKYNRNHARELNFSSKYKKYLLISLFYRTELVKQPQTQREKQAMSYGSNC